MFRTLFWSLKKSSRLKTIARKLTPTLDSGELIMRSIAEGGFDALKSKLNKIKEDEKELFALISEDHTTNELLQE